MILDGKKLASERVEGFSEEVKELSMRLDRAPRLCVVLVGEDPASQVYVGHKQKQCEKVGIESHLVRMPKETTREDLRKKLASLNADVKVDGILVQLPLPEHLQDFDPSEEILPQKDVDGLTAANMGLMIKGRSYAEPCTPKGIISLLKNYGVDLKGKKAAVIGRSQIVGWPMAWMLTRENATVTVCHSKTEDLRSILKDSDVVVVAAGRPEFLDKSSFKKGASVIDVGIHRKENKKLVGDVNTQGFLEAGLSYSPVPGGVGPMTVNTLLENLIGLVKHKLNSEA